MKHRVQKADPAGSLDPIPAPAQALVRAVLDVLGGWSWLADGRGTVRTRNGRAETLPGAAGSLPILEGPHVSVDLAELVATACAESRPLELTGLELNLEGGDKRELAGVRIIPLNLPAEWSRLFLVTVTTYAPAEDLSIQCVQNEKLQSLTGLAAKIAHELNNPLDGSMRYINLALRRLQLNGPVPSEGKVAEYLSSAREALGKINDILSDLVRFARSGQANVECISINDMVEQAVRTLAARAGTTGVRLVTVLAEGLPRAGGPRLYQVFCNLLKNAVDAVVERRRVEPEAPAAVTIRTQREGTLVRIIFEDTGIGLPPMRDCLFEPFFTTKPAGEGTGLGLAISREIVLGYGGAIRAEDTAQRGARFTIDLPSLEPAAGKEDRDREN